MNRRGFLLTFSAYSISSMLPFKSYAYPGKWDQYNSETYYKLRAVIDKQYAHGEVTILDGWVVSLKESELHS
jgi:hypothetical protein